MAPITATRSASPQSGTLHAILDAAEQIFGIHGFEGGGMRAIAEQAGIAQSLLHYHFRNKLTLYEATFERRASIIREVRINRLIKLFESKGSVRLEDVLSVLFMSLDDLLGEPKGKLRYYVQMLAAVTISPDERSVAIVRKFYDPSAEHFIGAFRKVVHGLTQEQAVWAYLFAIGARLQAHAPSGRAERLGAKSSGKKPYSLLVRFTAAGIAALVKD
jgi:AcrR family transcriptional regulator